MIARALRSLLLVLVLLPMSPASAHDHRPPRTRIVIGDQAQRGRQGSYCWTEPTETEGECVGYCADYAPGFPDPIAVGAGQHAADLILRTRHRPRRLSISSYREVNEYGMGTGSHQPIQYELIRERHRGRVRFVARMTVVVEDHLYIDVFGVWRDCQGCGGDQDSSWSFHLSAA